MSTTTTTIPKGAYCIEDAEWTRTDDQGRQVTCYCGTYKFPNGKLAGFLTIESVGTEVLDEFFELA